MVFACRHATDVLRLPVLVLRHGCALVFCHSQHFLCVIPNASEESSAWMLRSVQHDKGSVIPNASEESTYGCFASLSMTRAEVSFRAFSLCHSERSEESSAMWILHFAALRSE